MICKHFFLLGFIILGIINLHGKTIVGRSDLLKPSVNWQEYVPTVKEKYPCVLVLEYDLNNQSQYTELEKSENRQLISPLSFVPLVVLDRTQINELFKLEKAEGNLYLVSLKENKIVKVGNFPLDNLSDATKTVEFLEKFLLEGEEFSKEWEKFSTEKANPEKITELFKTIENGNFKERKTAKSELTKLLPANFKQVYQQAQDKEKIELRESCRDLIISYRGKLATITGVPKMQNQDQIYYHNIRHENW